MRAIFLLLHGIILYWNKSCKENIYNLGNINNYACLTSPPYHKLIWNLLLLLLLLRIFTGSKEQGIKRSLWSERASISWSLISPMSLQVTLFRPSLIHATKPMGDGLSHCWKFSWPKLEYRTNVVNTGQMLWIQDKCCGSDMQRKLTTMIRGAVTQTDAD